MRAKEALPLRPDKKHRDCGQGDSGVFWRARRIKHCN